MLGVLGVLGVLAPLTSMRAPASLAPASLAPASLAPASLAPASLAWHTHTHTHTTFHPCHAAYTRQQPLQEAVASDSTTSPMHGVAAAPPSDVKPVRVPAQDGMVSEVFDVNPRAGEIVDVYSNNTSSSSGSGSDWEPAGESCSYGSYGSGSSGGASASASACGSGSAGGRGNPITVSDSSHPGAVAPSAAAAAAAAAGAAAAAAVAGAAGAAAAGAAGECKCWVVKVGMVTKETVHRAGAGAGAKRSIQSRQRSLGVRTGTTLRLTLDIRMVGNKVVGVSLVQPPCKRARERGGSTRGMLWPA
jgi:hypothetical protein